jgi:outer membrane receptor protein involved in Fe transport
VRDWGLSGEVKYELGDVNLTSITAYRDYNLDRAQDADFNNFDIFYRPEGYNLRFKTFSQELRAQGSLFDDRVDWLVGGYYANEKLNNTDNLKFGTQFGQYANLTAGGALGANPASAPLVPAFNAAGGFAGLPTFVNLALSANPLLPAAARAAIVAQVQPLTLSDVGVVRDNYRQTSENFALFTHNVINVTDQFSVTLGLRYTNETKTLNASLLSNNNSCAALRTTLTNLAALGTANPALAPATGQVSQILGGLAGIPCLVNLNTTVDGTYRGRKKEDEFSGTAVLSYKFNDDLLAYASYSRGYKAGGFNLDRSALDSLPLTAAQVAEAAAQGANRQNNGRPEVQDLLFEPEFVDSYELGLKFNGREIDVNVALFRSDFEQFQLNTFNGTNFLVENIVACKGALGAPASLPTRGNTITGSCTGGTRPGVRSQGVEVEAFLYPAEDLQVTFGGTYADTKYRERLVGIGGRPIVNDLFRLPGSRLSNAAQYVVSGSTTFTPEIGDTGLRGLLYADFRYQSDINTGSDLDIEKVQDGFITVNARLGLQGPERRWSVELWAQNLLDQDYTQVGFDAPLQPLGGPSGSRVTDRPQGSLFAADRSTALFGRFLAEPRTYGVTVRTRF